MSTPPQQPAEGDNRSEMERLAEARHVSLAGEFLYFLREHKKWWLSPLLLMLALYGLFMVASLAGGPAFMYTLF